MMTSLAQNFQPHPGGMQQHPGVPQGHMAGPHPNQGQPGPGMPQQMHMGVSGPGPGPQVSQAGAMMGGMPPGVGGPSAHALQHLNPGQAQQAQYLQQQQQMFQQPNMQQIQQQQIIQHQRQQQAARQALLTQQYSGVQPGMQNGMNQMTQAQYQAMRGVARPVNLPQHLQQQQQQAQQQAQQHNMEQQQALAHAQQQQHQQQLMSQQIALQQQANAQGQGGNQGHPNQMNPQQLQNLQQAQIAAQQQQQQQQAQQQQQQAQQAQAAANQQNQQQAQNQNQAQQMQQSQQPQPQGPQQQLQQVGLQQQQQAAAAMLQQQQQQQRQGEKSKGQCLMKLMQFGDHLSNFGGPKQRDDLGYWLLFVERFFSPKGVLRHSVWVQDEKSNKQYEITFPALARYFHTHFDSGVKNMQLIMEKGSEKELAVGGHYVESPKSSFVYWFDNGTQLIANGTLKAYFDSDQKIELLEFITSSHEEYIPRNRIIEGARPLHEWQKAWHNVNTPADGKPSPEMNKKKAKAMKSPPQPPPEIDIPASKVKTSMGITPSVFRFLELAEVMTQMNPLFHFAHQNTSLSPYVALEQYVSNINTNAVNNPGTSPAVTNLQLPGSPHINGSPAQAPGMLPQHSQHGTNSSGPSANTSPNASNKRRRPSAVKAEDDGQPNGTPQTKTAVKPSPRIGGKRQKGNAT